jgi:hypothetical protein
VIDVPAQPAPEAPVVLGTRVTRGGLVRPAVTRPKVAPRVVRGSRVGGQVLPFTGGDVLPLALVALGLLASGFVTVVATRK